MDYYVEYFLQFEFFVFFCFSSAYCPILFKKYLQTNVCMYVCIYNACMYVFIMHVCMYVCMYL